MYRLLILAAFATLAVAVPQHGQTEALFGFDLGGKLCDMCVQEVGQLLNNATLQNLLARLEKFCDKLPGGLAQKCHDLLESKGEEIINKIIGMDPMAVCQKIHLCPQQQHKRDVEALEKRQVEALFGFDLGGKLCDMCVQEVGQLLNNATLQNLLARLEAFCDKLPGGLAQKCHDLLESKGEEIINKIIGMDPMAVCQKIHLCPQQQHKRSTMELSKCKRINTSDCNAFTKCCTQACGNSFNHQFSCSTVNGKIKKASCACDGQMIQI
jgi:vacuolar-type H+-ATPase subunit D/Vma8